MKPLPAPNMSPHPSAQKATEETANTMTFLERILTAFFALAKPDSTIANPRFMKNTGAPVRSTHIVSIITFSDTERPPA
jgi:hypothetical protein